LFSVNSYFCDIHVIIKGKLINKNKTLVIISYFEKRGFILSNKIIYLEVSYRAKMNYFNNI